MIRRVVLLIIILLFVAGCQQTLVALEITDTPTAIPLDVLSFRPTHTPQTIEQPAATVTSLPPTITSVSSVPPPATPLNSTGIQAVDLPAVGQQPTLPSAGNTFLIGQSVQGRDIVAWRFGTGERILLLVGGIHTGFETNTVMLVNELVTHLQGTPANILPGMSLVLIPVANPDGLTLGREASGRFNANRVDLNRNWGCEWEATAYWRNQTVDPGSSAFSEPETRALAAWIRDHQPSAVVFYHAAGRGVFAGNCDGDHGSAQLAAVYGEAAGYPYGAAWSAYPVSGTAATWVDGLGIPAVDLELSGTRATELIPNLRGIIATQCWLAGQTAAVLPECRQ